MKAKEKTQQIAEASELLTFNAIPSKGLGAPTFFGRQRWDLLKLDYDDVVGVDWALDENYEPFGVTTEVRKVGNSAIALNPAMPPNQMVPVAVVWLRRPAIKDEKVQDSLDRLKAKREEAKKLIDAAMKKKAEQNA